LYELSAGVWTIGQVKALVVPVVSGWAGDGSFGDDSNVGGKNS
jgi:hypothetical protein